jgi:NAD(P)-dependent dehydrogenase (short-subunit alcohol dehydrogenase family)
MTGDFVGKTVVITGAGVGLGRAIARRFASEGETCVLLGRTLSKVQGTLPKNWASRISRSNARLAIRTASALLSPRSASGTRKSMS